MEKIDMLLWVLGSGFALNFSLLLVMWNNINHRIDKLEEKITDIDRRLCRLEGAFTAKECCRIHDDRDMKRVE